LRVDLRDLPKYKNVIVKKNVYSYKMVDRTFYEILNTFSIELLHTIVDFYNLQLYYLAVIITLLS